MPKLYRLYRYAVFLLGRFKWLILLALITFVLATGALYVLHPAQRDPATHCELPEVAFGVFELMFASQPALPYPKGSALCEAIFFTLPVFNMLGLAAAVAQFSQILFDRSLYNRAQAENAAGHIILCGLGRLGREVLRQLDTSHNLKRRRDIVVVESGTGEEALEADLIHQEPIIPVIHGNMTHAATLREAGIDRAVAVIALSGNDSDNLEAALLAREMNPNVRVIVRMDNKHVRHRLDALLQRGLTKNLQFVDSVAGAAPFCVDLCPAPPAAAVAAAVPIPGSSPAPIIICGLGRLGFGVVRLLKPTTPLVVIDRADNLLYADESLTRAAPATPILRGDMTRRRVLLEAGVDRASAVLILTPDDTANLETAMLVHELNPAARIVLRINNSRIARRLDAVLREALGESLRVIDPFQFAAPKFIEAIGDVYDAATPGTSAAPN